MNVRQDIPEEEAMGRKFYRAQRIFQQPPPPVEGMCGVCRTRQILQYDPLKPTLVLPYHESNGEPCPGEGQPQSYNMD